VYFYIRPGKYLQ